MDSNWRLYSGALIWKGDIHTSPKDLQSIHQALRESKAMFARWTSDFDCGHKTEWWYCICDTYTPLDKLTAKQRYRIKKGLQQCEIVNARTDKRTNGHAIYELVKASFEDYPAEYRPNMKEETFSQHLQNLLQDDANDVWLVYDKENTLVGYCQCTRKADTVWLEQVKVPTVYLDLEVNSALVYRLCEYYLAVQHCSCICDGERNIKHKTNYQDFLAHVLNFRYAYCTLNIAYKTWMKIIVDVLFPFRNAIGALGKWQPMLYNIYCVLLQEQIRRTFEK